MALRNVENLRAKMLPTRVGRNSLLMKQAEARLQAKLNRDSRIDTSGKVSTANSGAEATKGGAAKPNATLASLQGTGVLATDRMVELPVIKGNTIGAQLARQRTVELSPANNVDKIARDWTTNRPSSEIAAALLKNDGSFDSRTFANQIFGGVPEKVGSPKEFLFVLPEVPGEGNVAGGTWASEAFVTAATLIRAGHKVTFGTFDGKPAHILPVSDGTFPYRDPAIGGEVTGQGEIDLAKAFADPNHEFGKLMKAENLLNVSQYLPYVPMWNETMADPANVAAYGKAVDKGTKALTKRFAGLVLPGGSGGSALAGDQMAHDLVSGFVSKGKPVGAICNAAAIVAQTRNPKTGLSVMRGVHNTTHSPADDSGPGINGVKNNALSAWGMMNKEGGFVQWPTGVIMPSALLTDASGHTAFYHSEAFTDGSAVLDSNPKTGVHIATGRTTGDGALVGAAMLKMTEGNYTEHIAQYASTHRAPAKPLDTGISKILATMDRRLAKAMKLQNEQLAAEPT